MEISDSPEATLKELFILAKEVVDTYEGFDTTLATERLRCYLESHGITVRRSPKTAEHTPLWRGISR